MMIEAATDYTKPNSVQNYMFQIFNLTPSVTTDADADLYDSLRINYYGQTQTAGNLIQFYQRGVMMGLPVDPSDQNVYANEQWFKDACSATIMQNSAALSAVGANSSGRSQLLAVLQSAIDQAPSTARSLSASLSPRSKSCTSPTLPVTRRRGIRSSLSATGSVARSSPYVENGDPVEGGLHACLQQRRHHP